MRVALRWLLGCGFLVCLQAQAELQLVLQPRGLNAEQRLATEALLADAANALPPSLRLRLDKRIPVRWSERLGADVIGRATGSGTLLLNRRWLQRLLALEARADAHSELLATLLHELAHFYDRIAYWPEGQRALLLACRQQQESLGPVGLPPRCRGEGERQFSLSDDPRLLDLAGWPEQAGQRGVRVDTNPQRDRSPDRYELNSPSEFAAVNLEYFLLDPQYACRRPALYGYFTQHFGWAPPTAADCAHALPYVNASLDEPQAVGRIDPERVYAVHYLLAEPNEAWASRWGHSMLRLVICAPGRPRGPDCLLDVSEHLVLSFRAFVEDVQLSSWDGLVGNYPSRLFILPLTQVVDEYTKLELRSLSSVPLRFSRSELNDLLQQALQLHWSYDGDYYFINNNCAVETRRLLRVGTQSPALRDLQSITPTGLLSLLTARGIADQQPLQDRQQALRLGYFFDSFRERYQLMFTQVQAGLDLPVPDVEAWFALSAEARAQWLGQGDVRTTAALLLLEQAAQRRQLLLVRQELKERYLSGRGGVDTQLGEAESLLQELLAQSGFLSRPAELLPEGYGLPQPDEWQQLQQQSEGRRASLQAMTARLDDQLLALLDAARQAELSGGTRNIRQLAERLKALHQAAGGVQLP
ncbi:DUF7844 domain-containing protein [Halopseudomonas sp.]|uniref:DUF7844 domain-containing protein n=1 Tax=Halopseudomonas sp. TaxID=2901191 RepID=UPI0030030963